MKFLKHQEQTTVKWLTFLICILFLTGCAGSRVLPEHLAEPCTYPEPIAIEEGSDILIMLAGIRQAFDVCAEKHRLTVEFINGAKP